MKKKLIVLGLLFAAGLGLMQTAWADAPKARTADETNYIVGVSHITNGNTLIVDSEGRAYIRDLGGHTIASQWGDGLVYTGDAVVHRVIVQGQTADDYAAVYDATSATGTAKADPQSATAKQTASVDLGGALFSTGIYVDATGGEGATLSGVLVTVIYDPL